MFATTQAAFAADATGTWTGTQKCKLRAGDVKTNTDDTVTFRVTRLADDAAAMELTVVGGTLPFDIRVWSSAKDPNKATTASVSCRNDGDVFEGPSANPFEFVDSCKVKVDPASGDGKMICKGTMVDQSGSGPCKGKYTRVDTADPNIPDCHAQTSSTTLP